MYTHCEKCLTSRSGDVLGAPCRTEGCDGIITEVPAWSSLVDVLPETFSCGRRGEDAGCSDSWEKFKRIDNRVCSYCGSLHPDDLFRLVRECAESDPYAPYRSTVEVEPSDKRYKIYIYQPGVRNAHEGGIKFYTHHLPRNADGSLAVTDQQQEEYGRACRVSRARFNRMLAEQRASFVRRVEG